MKVSIVVVSFNAARYARKMMRSLRQTEGVDFEIVVVDNDSRVPARLFWTAQRWLGRVNRLALLDTNTFFAEGCNIGVSLCARDTTHVLLLNTDCEVRDPLWLRKMLDAHQRGGTGLRYIVDDVKNRTDGFCFLIDRDLWGDGLDEAYQWWWSVTALQARLLREGHTVQAVEDYEPLVVHHGGKSGTAHTKAASARADAEYVAGWFEGHDVKVLERL